MRTILLLLVLLLAVGALAASVDQLGRPAEQVAPSEVKFDWVRTVDGWEHPSNWQAPYQAAPLIHPGVAASLFAFASLAALIAWPTSPAKIERAKTERTKEKPAPSPPK